MVGERTINVSVDNINSAIETALRSIGGIGDDEIDIKLKFGALTKGFTVIENGLRPTDVIPITVIYAKEVKEAARKSELKEVNGQESP